MRIAFALPGLHRVTRGAEVALESVANELAAIEGVQVTLIGSGTEHSDRRYRFLHAGCIGRKHFERWPRLPMLRGECVYEELSFLPGLLRAYDSREYDLTVTCGYPYMNWALRAPRFRGRRPAHVYVTQNGDWPARGNNSEYRFFGCEGLICTNPEYFERNEDRWQAVLIPNGVDPATFYPGQVAHTTLPWPDDKPVALMVSALIDTKRVLAGIRCAARVEGLHLVVAGDGPLRQQVDALGKELMAERFRRITLPREQMPDLYRSADVFLHMSMIEPSANAYMEALATGLPIVTHDRKVTRWTLEDQAVLVDTCDEAKVADGIRRALALRTPEHIVARRELVQQRFAWQQIAQDYATFFEQVLARR
jgi:glycosyltransferase involved in cell wall biosynthesis